MRPVLFLLVLSGATAACWFAGTLRIEEVRVVGPEALSPSVIVETAGLSGTERIALTRLSRVARRVGSLPAVRRATVRRALPNAIVIRVWERVPVATLDVNPDLSVDSTGHVFRAARGSRPMLQGWTGKAASGTRVGRVSTAILAAFSGFPSELRDQTAAIRSGPDSALVLHGGTIVRFGRPERLGAKALAAAAVLRDATKRSTKLEYIDVRAPRTPVAKQVATPAPTPAPTHKRTSTARAATAKPSARPTTKPTPKPTARPSPTPASATPAR